MEHLTVTYLHKTVHEFITADEIWPDIRALTDDSDITIPQRLMFACLATLTLVAQLGTDMDDWYKRVALELSRDIERTQPQIASEYLEELDDVMVVFNYYTNLKHEPEW